MLIQQAQLLKRLGLPGNVYVCPIHGARRMRNSDDSKGLTSFFDVQYTGKWSTNKAHLAEARANLCPYMRELYRDCSVDPEIVTQIVTPDPSGIIHLQAYLYDIMGDKSDCTIVVQRRVMSLTEKEISAIREKYELRRAEIVTQIVTPPKALTHAERQKVYRARHKA